MKRLGDRYTWQEIGEAEYRAERQKLEAMLVELPLPAESNLVAFDRAAALYEEIGAIISDTTREHQRQHHPGHRRARAGDRGRRERDPGAARGAAVLRGLRRRGRGDRRGARRSAQQLVAGAPGRTRTADAHLRTVPLYPLSYGGAERNRSAAVELRSAMSDAAGRPDADRSTAGRRAISATTPSVLLRDELALRARAGHPPITVSRRRHRRRRGPRGPLRPTHPGLRHGRRWSRSS